MVILRCFPEASLASATNKTASAEIVLSDPASREKSGAGAGSRRNTKKKNMLTGGRSIILRLGQSICVLRDSRGIGMMIGSDHREVSGAMAETEALIFML